MAGTITALAVQKRNKQRVNVYLDGEFAFGLALMEAARLHKGQHLSDAEIEALKTRDIPAKAYERALRFLSFRPRSASEVQRNLRDHAVPPWAIDETLERLERAGLVNDAEFARFWIDNRQQFRPRSPRALRYELRHKGVADAVIDEALAGVDAEELALRAARHRLRRLHGADPETIRRKLSNYLARQGFAYPLIRDVVDRLIADWEPEEADSA
jgi:regulatory protein